ncbi:MAG: alpha/beta hydrolase [Rubrivivax sp.]|nr:alpha/beta hydrolase [Rubrivivax sp.]
MLLLHGIGGVRALWGASGSGTLSALGAAGWRAAAPDLPGYGGSAVLGTPTLGAMVDAVRAVARRLGADRTVLVGHSMGGMVAQELAARHPDEVQGLVLVCTSSAFGRTDGDWQARFVAERLAPLDAGIGMAGLARQIVPELLAPQAAPEARQAALDAMSSIPEPTYRAALTAIAGFDRREALGCIGVPTLLVAGEFDRTAPPDVMSRMAARVAGAEFVQLAGAGHLAPLERPAAFHDALLDFLSRRLPGPAAGRR